nr:hypothetical protein [Hydrococcus sp. Prado102]
MNPNEEIISLRKAKRLDEAYSRGYELYKEYPEDRSLANSLGWVLYDKVKKLVTEVDRSQATATEARKNELYKILREYADLKLSRPDRLFSLLLFHTLRFPKELAFLPGFMKWAGLDCFQLEDYKTGLGKDNNVFESLVEKAAREVGKVARKLNDRPDLQEFAIALINKTLDLAQVQQPEWLHYYKALLLKQLGHSKEAQKLLVSVVKEKRHDFWAWRALANVLESDPTLALALYSKACLTCKDAKFGVSTYEDLSKLAAKEEKFALAKWAADRALTVREENEWSLPPSLRELLNADWYLQAEKLANAEKLLVELAADAQKVIWANCPRRDANYLGTFTTPKGKRMVKFGLFFGNCCEQVLSPAGGLLNNLNLILGDPVTV